MKKVLSFVLIFSLLLAQTVGAEVNNAEPCIVKKSEIVEGGERLCNNVEDIICKDVKKEERRGCNGEDKTIIRKNMTGEEVFSFAKGCFKSSATSFKNFFTEFIPELLGAMWKLLRGAGELTINSFSSKPEEVSWWGKIKGIYESSRSISADIYEAAKQSPGEFISGIWDKIVDAVGPVVASYDCLKPQLKVEKICGFIAGWVVPPLMLAKLLVRGAKFAKESLAAGAVFVNLAEKLKLQKMLEYAEKKPKITMKEYQHFFDKYKSLGYTDEEFDFLNKSGALQKIKLEDLKSLATLEGKKQREELLKEFLKSKIIAVAIAASAEKIIKTRAAKVAKEKAADSVRKEMTGDYVTFEGVDVSGNKAPVLAKITGRHMDGNREIAYTISYLEPKTGIFKEVTMSPENLAVLKPNAANAEMGNLFETAAKKDPGYKDPLAEFKRLQKEQADARLSLDSTMPKNVANQNAIKKVEGIDVEEVNFSVFEDAKKAQNPVKPVPKEIVQDSTSLDFNLSEAEIKKAKESSAAIREKIEAENIRNKERNLNSKPKNGNGINGEVLVSDKFKSNFLMINAKNEMGMVGAMSAEIVKKVLDDGVEKFVVRVFDSTTRSYLEKRLTLGELRGMHPKESEKAFKEIEKYKKENGHQSDGL